MPKLAANLTMLFGDVPFLDRFESAARAGFKGIEYLFPYDYPAATLKQKLRDHGFVQVLHNLPAGDWELAPFASLQLGDASLVFGRMSYP